VRARRGLLIGIVTYKGVEALKERIQGDIEERG
jgi:hypothetical protein